VKIYAVMSDVSDNVRLLKDLVLLIEGDVGRLAIVVRCDKALAE